MRNASALVFVGKQSDPAKLGGLIEVSKDFSWHISLQVAGILPLIQMQPYSGGAYGSPLVPNDWYETVETNAQDMSQTAAAFGDFFLSEGIEADIRVLCSERNDLKNRISHRALSADILMASDDLRQEQNLFDTIVQGALFSSSVGVLLNATGTCRGLAPRRVFVAWNYGVQAARAVRAALPILLGAEEVTLAIFDPVMTEHDDGENPGSDVARWLTHYGCNVTVQQFPSGGIEIAQAIETHAVETAADLIVMGAYDHSWMREIVFGGTTQTMIEQTRMPVFLAH